MAEDEQSGRRGCRRRGRSRYLRDHRQLTEVVAGTEVTDVLVTLRDRDGAVQDHEELVAWRALLCQDLAFADIDLIDQAPDLGEVVRAQPREQGHLREHLQLLVHRVDRPSSPATMGSRSRQHTR